MSNVFSGLVRIGSEPEVRHLASGQAVLVFNAASSTGFGDKQKTMWLRVSYWRNAEKLQQFLHKGDPIVISGELSQREYEQDGVKRTSLELNANVIDLVGGQRNDAPSQPKSTQQRPSQAAPAPVSGAPNYDDFDDMIPF